MVGFKEIGWRRRLEGPVRPAGVLRRWVWPLITAVLIVIQQRAYYLHPETLAGAPVITDTTTIHEPRLHDYGLCYWGLVPVYSLDLLADPHSADANTPAGAARLLAERGETLRMEYINTLRIGERMVKVMKAPLFLWRGTPLGAEHRIIFGFAFTLALVTLAFALGRYAPFPLGVVLPLMLSSSRFAAADIYARHMTQTVLITAMAFAMALLAPVIFERNVATRSQVLRGLLLAAIIVFFMNIRSTITPLYLAVLLVLVTYRRRSIAWRLGVFAALLACHVVLAKAFDAWWEAKFDQASAVVEELGGQPYRGIRKTYHSVYHSIWCGLGDFDRKYGYRWSDNQPESFAWPVLQARGQSVDDGADQMGYTGAGAYVEYQPGYGDVLRERLFDNIRADPGWYARIILKRVERILWENEPARLAVGGWQVVGPQGPWAYLAVLVVILALRLWGYVKLVLLAMPTLAVPLIVTTFGGQQVEFVAHIVAAAVGVTLAWQCLAASGGWLWRRVCRKGAACAG